MRVKSHHLRMQKKRKKREREGTRFIDVINVFFSGILISLDIYIYIHIDIREKNKQYIHLKWQQV